MGLGEALRAISRPLALARRMSHLPLSPLPGTGIGSITPTSAPLFGPVAFRSPWAAPGVAVVGLRSIFQSLTETRFPKRRPGAAPRRKRASLRPRGPYAWVQSVPGEPLPRCQPNEGSIKARGRNEKKRIKQRKAFILAEKKKREAQYAESRRKKGMERIERKMAEVAREKAWAQRLTELQQLEAAKKAAMSS